MTRPRTDTSQEPGPRRNTATGSSGTTRMRSVWGNARSTTELRTAGRPSTRCATAAATASDRPDGTRRSTSTFCLRGNARTFSPTVDTSPCARAVLRGQRRQLELPEEDDLVLELDAVLLPRAAPRLCDQRERIVRPSAVRILDEVRVARGDLRTADPVTLQPAGLEQAAGGQLVVRILEDAAERSPVRRLGRLPLRLQVGDDRFDLVRGSRRKPELHLSDDLAGLQAGVPVTQPKLGRGPPRSAFGADDERSVDNRGPVAPVRAGVHPDAAPGRAGNRARELEAAQPGCARAMERDGIRRASPGHEQLSARFDLRQRAYELQHEPVEAVVGDEQFRAEPDSRHRKLVLARETQCLLELADALGACECARAPARADRGEAGGG